MIIFDFLGGVLGEIVAGAFLEGLFKLPVKIYEWITGKKTRRYSYRTEYKKFIKFSVATKFLLAWETDIENLKEKLVKALDATNENISITDFQFTPLSKKTVVQPPASISFSAFHFLVRW